MNDRWKDILEHARFAPSPHNIQPWKIKIINDTQADIYYDPTRLLPDTDPSGRFTTLGFGILIECIIIVANKYGLRIQENYPNTVLDATQKELTYFATINLTATNHQETLSGEHIINRRTSRLPYNDYPVAQPILDELTQIAHDYGHTYTATSDLEMVHWTLLLNRDTLFYDMTDDKARKEVGHWVRSTNKDAQERKDGLAAYALGFPGWLVSLFIYKHEIMELPLLKQLIQSYYMTSMQGTRTVAWISGPFFTPSEWLNTGHMLARLWLTMTKHDIYLHPFGSIITNSKAHKILADKIKVDESNGELWLIMRLGNSQEPPRSQRLDLNDILMG